MEANYQSQRRRQIVNVENDTYQDSPGDAAKLSS